MSNELSQISVRRLYGIGAPRVRGLRLAAASLAVLLPCGEAVMAQQPAPFRGIKLLNNGNFGVNTSAPEAPLHVEGDALVSGAIKGKPGLGKFYGDAAILQGYAENSRPQFVLQYIDGTPGELPEIRIVNTTASRFKTFVIPHPADPQRYLVHATLEGPEGAVYYRGSTQLRRGSAEIVLPPWFEKLARAEGRTVLLTNVDGFDPIAVKRRDGATVRDGRFTVVSSNPDSEQAFDWEVKAVRADVAKLDVEPRRDTIAVSGFGPYTFVAGER
jgi:hypothetical protein